MSKIRVTYSGLIALGIRLVSIFTGLIFTVIITRQLTPEDFGLWGLINGIIFYALILSPIINYWTTREIARGEKTVKNSVFSNLILVFFGLIIYSIAAYLIGNESDVDTDIIIFSGILIPIIFLNDTFNAINSGSKPQVVSYALITFEIVKILSAIILIFIFDYEIKGVIIAVFVGYISSVIISYQLSNKEYNSKINFKFFINKIKLFWIPTYRNFPALLATSDVIVFSIITGSLVGVAYFTASKTLGMMVNHVRAINVGLYPKLLESEKKEFIKENLIKFSYIGFPLTGFAIIFSKAGLYALNPIYEIAWPVVILISLKMFFKSLNQMFFDILLGLENIDKNKIATTKEFIRSNLFWVPTFDLIRHGIYIVSLIIIFIIFRENFNSLIELVIVWSFIGFIVEIPLTVYLHNKIKLEVKNIFEKKYIIKYLILTLIIFSFSGMILDKFIIYDEKFFTYFPQLIIFILIPIIMYLGITYFVDKKTKILFKSIFNEFRG